MQTKQTKQLTAAYIRNHIKPKYYKPESSYSHSCIIHGDGSMQQYLGFDLNQATIRAINGETHIIPNPNNDIFEAISTEATRIATELANHFLLRYETSKPEDIKMHKVSNNITVYTDKTCGSSLTAITGDTSLHITIIYALD